MQFTDFSRLDLSRVPSPCFVVDEVAVERNLRILENVSRQSGATILQALKAFSMYSLAPLSMRYLSGTCCSGLHEALLAREFYKGEIHVFAPGYKESELQQLLDFADHVVFNNLSQIIRYEGRCRQAIRDRPGLQIGLRVNPQHSEGEVPIYDPCAPGSRLGVTLEQLEKELAGPGGESAFELVTGIHFHTLCEQLFGPLERTLDAVETQFGEFIKQLDWINLGGGHHITRNGYEVNALIERIRKLQENYHVRAYLEPGEAVAIGTGVLVAEVVDIGFNSQPFAILDTSATCHMPDTLEMPYRADIAGAAGPGEKDHTYRLGGMTCLAGDVMGDYSFDSELKIGQRLVFEDMSHYTMVKTSTFNGTRLPAIAIWNSQTDDLRIIREFGYNDFKSRLS